MLINSGGTIQRDLRETSLMPSDDDLNAMLNSMNIVGMNPNDIPLSMKIATVLGMFRPVHSNAGVLIFEPGVGARVIEILRSGDTRMVKLKLPPHQVAHSIMTNKGDWFVRTHFKDGDTQWNLFQVDPETGETLKRIDTPGVTWFAHPRPDRRQLAGRRVDLLCRHRTRYDRNPSHPQSSSAAEGHFLQSCLSEKAVLHVVEGEVFLTGLSVRRNHTEGEAEEQRSHSAPKVPPVSPLWLSSIALNNSSKGSIERWRDLAMAVALYRGAADPWASGCEYSA